MDLYSEFYSGGKSVSDHSPLLMGALLILGKNHHQSAYAKLRWDQDMQKALYVAHYLKVDCYDFIQKMIDKPFMTRELSVFWPLVGKLQQSIMLDIWVNHDLVTLLQDISILPHCERVKAIDYINEQAPNASTDLDQINNFRKQLRLTHITSEYDIPANAETKKKQPQLTAEPFHKPPQPTKFKPISTAKPHSRLPAKLQPLRHKPSRADKSIPPLAEYQTNDNPSKAKLSRAKLAELKHINRLNIETKPPRAKLSPLGKHPSSYFSAPKKELHSESSPTLPPAAEKPSFLPAKVQFSEASLRVSVEKILVEVYTTIDAQQKNKRRPFSIYQTSNQREYIDPGIYAAANNFNCVIKQVKLAFDFPNVMHHIKQYCSRELSSYSRTYRNLLLQKLKALIQHHDPSAAVVKESSHSDEICQWFIDRSAPKLPAMAARAAI